MIICHNFERKKFLKGAFWHPTKSKRDKLLLFSLGNGTLATAYIFHLVLAMRLALALASAEPAVAASANSWRAKA